MALTNDIKIVEKEGEFSDNSVNLTFSDMIVNLPLEGMVDMNAEKERVEKEIARLKSEIERSEKMLSNEGFVAKAPAKLIESEKEKLSKNKALLEELSK
jgi:valyl-tRNA synthetase